MAQADNEKAAVVVAEEEKVATPAPTEKWTRSEDSGAVVGSELATLSSSDPVAEKRNDSQIIIKGEEHKRKSSAEANKYLCSSAEASKHSCSSNSTNVHDSAGLSFAAKSPGDPSPGQIANDIVDPLPVTVRSAGGGQVTVGRPAGLSYNDCSSPPPPLPQQQHQQQTIDDDDDKNNNNADTKQRSKDALVRTSKDSVLHPHQSLAPQPDSDYSGQQPQQRGEKSSPGTVNSKPILGQKQQQHQQQKLLPFQSLLTGLELVRVCEGEEEDAFNAFSADHPGSSSSGTGSSLLSSAPLLPVPSAMAEAIKRQQKGVAVRYWKARHVQSNGGGHPPLSLRPGGFQSGVFPILKPPPASSGNFPHGGLGGEKGVGAMLNGVPPPPPSPVGKYPSKAARERAIRQRGKENQAFAERRRSSSTNSQYYPCTNTYFVFGSSLGYSPPPPAAGYKRSVSTLETLLSLPLQPSSSTSSSSSSMYPNPPSQKLTQGLQPSPESAASAPFNPKLTLSYTPDLTQNLRDTKLNPNPNPLLKLTHASAAKSPSQGLGQSVQVNGNDHRGGQLEVVPTTTEGQDQYSNSSNSGNGSDGSSSVAELTCMQLADTILATKTADLSRFYQICETKIRYVDLLERSAFHNNEATTKSPANSPRDTIVNTNVNGPTSKLPKPGLPDNLKANRQNSWAETQDGWGSDGEGEGRISPRKGLPVTLPSIVSPRDGLTLSRGFTMPSAYGMPPSSSAASGGGSFLLSQFSDVEFNSHSAAAVGASTTTSSSPNGVGGANGVLCKPILKPFNPDANLVSFNRNGHHHDPFSPRSPLVPPLNGALSVRGTTMYPMNADGGSGGGRWMGSTSGNRRSRSSTSRGEADMRKRAVRFSISDQVFEFAPGEPVIP